MSYDLRDFDPDAPFEGGTCDWGNCDYPAVCMRRSYNHGWLPVCPLHLGLSGIGTKWDVPLFPTITLPFSAPHEEGRG